jgi:hypothetical protein
MGGKRFVIDRGWWPSAFDRILILPQTTTLERIANGGCCYKVPSCNGFDRIWIRHILPKSRQPQSYR